MKPTPGQALCPRIALLFALHVLAGCAQTVWVKPGATAVDFERSKAICDYQSELGAPDEHIGYGMSGAIVSGIATGMRKATLMQKCLVAEGWHPEQAAALEGKRAQAKKAIDERNACFSEVRHRPEFASVQQHFPELGTGKYAMAELANDRVPTSVESQLIAAMLDAMMPCRTAFVETAGQISPPAGPVLAQGYASADTIFALLVQQKLTWGEAAQRITEVSAATDAKIKEVRG